MNEKKIILNLMIVVFLGTTISIFGQNENLTTPENAISTLFKSMHDGDSTLANLVFTDEASLNSVFTTKDGIQKVKTGKVSGFINAIGTPHDEIWDERVTNLKVQIDGDLAQAWMDYSFYLGDKFSHCGVNAMHLVRKDGEWKIFQLMDTRRKEDCN